jgi:energy-coupling factor transport system permease protein
MRSEFVEPEIKESFFHKLDVRVKLIMLICIALNGIILDNWKILLYIYIIVFCTALLSKISINKIKVLIILSFLSAWSIMWVQGMFYDAYPRTPIIYILKPMIIKPDTPIIGGLWEGIGIYYEGFKHGITQSLRLLSPMTLGLLIFWTEDPIKMLTGLNKMKVPYTICFMVMTCIRFIPITLGEIRTTINSQRLRKYNPFNIKGIIFGYKVYRTIGQTLVPILSNSVRRASNMARSADSRGFRAFDKRTELNEIKMTKGDYLILFIFVLVTFIFIVFNFLLYLFKADIYSNDILKPIYWITHKYL